MIKTERGETMINGTMAEALADFSVITDSLYKHMLELTDEDEAKRKLERAFERGFECDELECDSKEALLDILELLKRALDVLDEK